MEKIRLNASSLRDYIKSKITERVIQAKDQGLVAYDRSMDPLVLQLQDVLDHFSIKDPVLPFPREPKNKQPV